MTILIFTNGEIQDLNWVQRFLANDSILIAADGGAVHLSRLGVVPDVLIGDLDSIPDGLVEEYRKNETVIVKHDEQKDETDLELALMYAIKNFKGTIQVMGGLGGRIDQTLGNLLLLAHPGIENRRVELIEPKQRAWLIVSDTTVFGKSGDIISLIPIEGDVFVSKTSGLQWELIDEKLEFGLARGISNIMTSDSATISIKSGKLICVHSASR
jgi:thiamine pyrophosphokinase